MIYIHRQTRSPVTNIYDRKWKNKKKLLYLERKLCNLKSNFQQNSNDLYFLCSTGIFHFSIYAWTFCGFLLRNTLFHIIHFQQSVYAILWKQIVCCCFYSLSFSRLSTDKHKIMNGSESTNLQHYFLRTVLSK